MSQLQVTGEAKIRDIQGPVVANSGVVTALDGAASQYVRGDGTLADFPTSSGGGSSVSYYLNGSVNQGNIGGTVYYQMSKNPVIGTGTDFSISNNDLLAAFITDVNDPDLLEVPGGNFNCEFFLSVNNNTGNPYIYAELYKVNVSTFTLLGSSVSTPEYLNNGTNITPYYFAIPVATAALTATDRIAIRIFANVDGRTVTLHTENSHLCQIVTTFSKGLTALNNLTDQVQYFATGTSGTNFGIVSSGNTHTFNIPDADASARGLVTAGNQSFGGNKSFGGTTTAANLNVSGVLTVSGNLSNGTYSYTLPSAAGQLALTSQIPSITGASYIVSRFNLAGTALENSSISDTGTYTGSPTGQVIMNSRLTVNNYAEVNRYLSIAQNVDSAWALPSSGTNLEAFITSASGGVLVSDTGYLRPRKSSDDTFKRFIIQGDELILNDTTSRKTLINKAGPTQTTTKLEVAGYARFDNSINVNGVLYLNATDASQDTYFSAPSGNLSVVTSGTILLRSGTNTGVFVANTGFVGINGATPSEALTVNGGGLFTSPLLVTTNDNNFAFNVQLKNTNAGTQALTGLGLSDLGGTRKGQILWIPSNYITTSLQNSFLVSSVTNIPLILCADATGAATPNIIFQSGATNKMLLNGTSGNFSIGNTNNTYKLDVSGTGRFTDALTGTSATFSSTLTATDAVLTKNGDITIKFNPNNVAKWDLYYNNADGTIGFYDRVGSAFRMTLAQTGAATFSSSITATSISTSAPSSGTGLYLGWGGSTSNYNGINFQGAFATDMYFGRAISSDDLVIRSSGGERVRFTASGSVGIGTSSPGARLHVLANNALDEGAAAAIIRQGGGNNNNGLLVDVTNSVNAYIADFRQGNSSLVRIIGNGNVGIGTSSPTDSYSFGKALDVSGVNGAALYFRYSTDPTNQFGIIGYDRTGQGLVLGTNNALPILFNTSATERMRITSGGSVGIGTSSPGEKLTINGGLGFQYSGTQNWHIVSSASNNLSFTRSGIADRMVITSDGNVGIGTSSPGTKLTVFGGYTSFTDGTITVYAGTDGAGGLYGTTTNHYQRFITNNEERMKIAANGAVSIVGSLSKGSGSFKIDHPLESMSETHHLVHSFVESPQANNIYRGKVQLVNGIAEVNLDQVSTMTEGTFILLNREIHTYTSNETDWDAVRGKVEGNILTIECQNNESNAIVSWLVIGERQDKHMMETEWTDENGRVIVEPLKPIKEKAEEIEELKNK